MSTSDKDKRQGWLRDLTSGDLVAVGYGRNDYRGIMRITEITKSGRIRCGTHEYSHEGRRRDEKYKAWLMPFCQEAVDVVRKLRDEADRMKKRSLRISTLRDRHWESCSDETLAAICKLLDEADAKKAAASNA